MKNICKHVPSCIIALVINNILFTTPAFAQTVNGVYQDDVVTLAWIETLFSNILSIALQMIGIAAFIMLIYGGGLYLFSSGDQQKTQQAKAVLTYAIVGVLLTLGAWFILLFISQFTGNDAILNFNFQM